LLLALKAVKLGKAHLERLVKLAQRSPLLDLGWGMLVMLLVLLRPQMLMVFL